VEGPSPSGLASLPACRDLEFYGHNEMSGGASTVLDDGARTCRYPVPGNLSPGQTQRSASSIEFG
jgi:hypothetical protein